MQAGCEAGYSQEQLDSLKTASCCSISRRRIFGRMSHVPSSIFPIRDSFVFDEERKRNKETEARLKSGYVAETFGVDLTATTMLGPSKVSNNDQWGERNQL